MSLTPAPRATVVANMGIVWVVWGSTYMAIAVLVQSAPPMLGMAVRVLSASALLAAILAVTRGPGVLRITRHELRAAALLGLITLGGGIGIVSLAVRYVPTGVAALLVASAPIWGVIIRTIAGERPHWFTFAGVAVGILGIALLVRPAGHELDGQRLTWSLAIIGGQVLFAFGSFLTPRVGAPRDALVLVMYEFIFGGLLYLVLSKITGEQFDVSAMQGRNWAALAYLIVSAVVGYGAYTWLLGHVPLSLALTYAYVNPLVAVTLGAIVLSEPLTAAILVGGAVTIAGVFLVITGERSTAPREVAQDPVALDR